MFICVAVHKISCNTVVLDAFSAETLTEAGEETRGPAAAEVAVAAPAAAARKGATADAAMRSGFREK